jgi:beta-galactosidase
MMRWLVLMMMVLAVPARADDDLFGELKGRVAQTFKRAPALVQLPVYKARDGAVDLAAKVKSVRGGPFKPTLVSTAGRLPQPCFERQGARDIVDLDGAWRRREVEMDAHLSLSARDEDTLRALEAECGGATAAAFDDSGWETVTLPAIHDRLSGRVDERNAYGPAGFVYRRAIDVPAGFAGRKVRWICLGANYVADLWVNGRHAGAHEGGFTSFAFEVGGLLVPGRNVLALRVHNPPWGQKLGMVPDAKSDWFNYGGPYRSTWLEAAPALSVDDALLRWDGRAHVRAVVSNAGSAHARAKLEIVLHDASVTDANLTERDAAKLAGAVAVRFSGPVVDAAPGQAREVEVSFDVPSPRLWAPGRPELYVLEARLVPEGGGEPMDRLSTQVGLRSLGTDGERLRLNGADAPFLAGVSRHEESVEHGRAVTPGEIARDMKLIRGLNANFVRTGHYPNEPLTYLIADRLGLAVWEEIPVYWFSQPHALRDAMKRGAIPRMWREMIARDHNRPSVLFWGTCNETMPIDARTEMIAELKRLRDAFSPDGRMVVQSAAPELPGPFDPSQKVCDAAGWTMYFGVGFHAADRFQRDLSRTYAGTAKFLDDARRHHPGKPILVSEVGFWAQDDDGLEREQERFFEDAMRAVKERRHVAAVAWWNAFDYYTGITGTSTFGPFKLDRVTERPLAATMRRAYADLTRP